MVGKEAPVAVMSSFVKHFTNSSEQYECRLVYTNLSEQVNLF